MAQTALIPEFTTITVVLLPPAPKRRSLAGSPQQGWASWRPGEAGDGGGGPQAWTSPGLDHGPLEDGGVPAPGGEEPRAVARPADTGDLAAVAGVGVPEGLWLAGRVGVEAHLGGVVGY